jgi:hypothetical protein
MFSTGKVGLWSIIEEGIGIFAGSIPALRPLLSRGFFGGSSSTNPNNTPGPNSGSNFKIGARSGSRPMGRNDINLDTFVELGDESKECDADANSQKHILKETTVSMTNDARSTTQGEWERSQVLGWKDNNFRV